MKSEKIEIRIDSYRKSKVKEIAKQNNITISKLLNDLIDLLIEENSTK